jgi:hypothetical protein
MWGEGCAWYDDGINISAMDINYYLNSDSARPGRTERAFKAGKSRAKVLAEGRGATMIARHWGEVFRGIWDDCSMANSNGACELLPKEFVWTDESFVRRIRPKILDNISSDTSHGPGQYCIYDDRFLSMEANCHNTVYRRFRCQNRSPEISADGNGLYFRLGPIDPKHSIRKPRACSHFRLFLAAGVICDYAYSVEKRCYVPARPEVMGLRAVSYSDMHGFSGRTKPMVLETWLPGKPLVDETAAMVKGFGVEFWFFGKGCVEGKVVGRVMRVG